MESSWLRENLLESITEDIRETGSVWEEKHRQPGSQISHFSGSSLQSLLLPVWGETIRIGDGMTR